MAVTTLSEGDAVVLYTDGVTEARHRTGDSAVEQFGQERLRKVLSSAREPVLRTSSRVEASVSDFRLGHLADDIGVLVMRATGPT